MGKTRSSRRMRNCKSRNKRGGKWSLFQSDLLTSFKSAVRHGVTSSSYQAFDESPTVELDDDMKEKIDEDLSNYDNFRNQILKNFVIKNDNDDGLNRCDSKNVEKLKSQINVESPKRKAYYLYALDKICEAHAKQEKKEEQKTNQGVTSHLAPFGIGREEEPSGLTPHESDTVFGPKNPNFSPGGFFVSKVPKKYVGGGEEYVLEAPSTYSGGKSRRRHRRGRTLHKRRKSSKVRKTRRTHSRTRR